LYQRLFRRLLTRFDAEQIHNLTLVLLRVAGNFAPTRALMKATFSPNPEKLSVSAFGLNFDHPLGLAAGFDKNGLCLPALNALGFSFVEVGTVTPQPQPGNPGPRIFRLPEDRALINRMGFPSAGMHAVQRNLSAVRNRTFPIGVSLGKNKDTPLIDAHRDYCAVLECLYPLADFFVVNISSPNTPELRKLQGRDYLVDLLSRLSATRITLAENGKRKPLLVKLSPDLTLREVDDILDVGASYEISGVVATNTTTSRDGIRSAHQNETGGLSGLPLRERSTALIRHISQRTEGKIPIIGVGGIFSGEDACEKLGAGATLVQAYTGLIYEGPGFARKVLNELSISRDPG
jgi:dihydroorotate dehydrogenase